MQGGKKKQNSQVKQDVEAWWVRLHEIKQIAPTKAQKEGLEILKKNWASLNTCSWEPCSRSLCPSPPLTQGKGLERQLSTVDTRKAAVQICSSGRRQLPVGSQLISTSEKPVIQPLLRMKVMVYGPSVGNFLKHMSEIMNLVSCTIN